MSNLEFQRELEDLLDKDYKEKLRHLGDGLAADYADYRERCGYLRAIRETGELCKMVAKKLYGG